MDYVNDPFVIARHDYMTAINTAIEVDLTGQVCADSIGDRFYSGIGGQVDFIRGAARARYGRPIICLPSTAQGGNVSRIKPTLTDGAGVVTTRGDVHFVVTEFGIAYLHGKCIRDRAMALIQIAHPKYRSWLLAEAKNRRYVYQHQPEPVSIQSLYPAEFEWNCTSRDGLKFRIRPIKPTDEAMLAPMYYEFSRNSLYRRILANDASPIDRTIQEFCTIDYKDTMTLIATKRTDVVTEVIAVAQYRRSQPEDEAQAGIFVAPDHRSHGVGVELARRLCDVARQNEVMSFRVDFRPADEALVRRVFSGHSAKCVVPKDDGPPFLRVRL